MEAYLKGIPEGKAQEGPWVSKLSFVEKIMMEKPETFKAGAAYERAARALTETSFADTRRKNIRRMMEIGQGLVQYAGQHDGAYPDNLAILFENGYLKAPFQSTSLLTGRPYVYVAAGEKWPRKASESRQFVLLYDDLELPSRSYQCVMAPGLSEPLKVEDVVEQLKARGKVGK